MGSPYRRPSWASRQWKSHPTMLLTGVVCAVVVLVEVGAFTNGFGLAGALHRSPPPPPPTNLNPHEMKILEILAGVSYLGGPTGYFGGLNGANLCEVECPVLPAEYPSFTPPQAGLLFFYNVTNTGTTDRNLSLPLVTTSGPNPLLFGVKVYCCYGGAGGQYSEDMEGSFNILAAATVGFEGYLWTTQTIPFSSQGGYTLYENFTAH